MRFGWSRSSTAEVADEEPAADPAPYDLAAIELLTTEGRLTGWISTDGERTSDWLNQRDELPIHGLGEVHQGSTELPGMPTAGVDLVERDRIIWAVPPPLPSNRHLRLHRRRMRIQLELEHHEVTGQVHVRPGADAVDAVLRGTRVMVPLTEVEIVSRDDPSDRCALPVVIVNASHVQRVVTDQARRLPEVETAPRTSPTDPRLAALGIADPVAEPVCEPPASATVEPPGPAPGPASAPAARRDKRRRVRRTKQVQAALSTLLEAGVIDISEFQAMRLRLGRPDGPA
jgi:hypothetical protein